MIKVKKQGAKSLEQFMNRPTIGKPIKEASAPGKQIKEAEAPSPTKISYPTSKYILI